MEPRQIRGENWMRRYAKEVFKTSNVSHSKTQHTFKGPDLWLVTHSVLTSGFAMSARQHSHHHFVGPTHADAAMVSTCGGKAVPARSRALLSVSDQPIRSVPAATLDTLHTLETALPHRVAVHVSGSDVMLHCLCPVEVRMVVVQTSLAAALSSLHSATSFLIGGVSHPCGCNTTLQHLRELVNQLTVHASSALRPFPTMHLPLGIHRFCSVVRSQGQQVPRWARGNAIINCSVDQPLGLVALYVCTFVCVTLFVSRP